MRMMAIALLGGWEILFLLAAVLLWGAAWGFSFALWEKRSLAPRRSFATGFVPLLAGIVPTSAPFALLSLVLLRGNDIDGPSLLIALLASALMFVASFVPTMLAFKFSRRLLHTRFDHDAPTDDNAAASSIR
jgi:hypothetical protein